MSKAHKDRMCVVCSRTHPPTIFSCRYKVHPKNVDVLCSFFERDLSQGELCDRCYRLWYKHRKQKEGGGSKSSQGKRKKKTTSFSKRKKSKPSVKRRAPSDDEEDEEEEEEEIEVEEEEEEDEEDKSDEEKLSNHSSNSNRKPIIAKKQAADDRSYETSSPALNESANSGRSSSHTLPHLEMQETAFNGYASSGSSGSSSSLAHRTHKGTSKENKLQSADIKEDDEDAHPSNEGTIKKESAQLKTPSNESAIVYEEEEPTSYPCVLQAILSRQDENNGLVQKLEALSALSTDVRKSKRKRLFPLKSPVKEDLLQLYRGNDPYYLQQCLSKMVSY